ncbi:PREDICTED: receptor-like serine/threonine-protein kinase At2g45590 [Nelumbo nucifera]|uniref:Receptor-like serine/threonine-protein kinase At2g45590 n=1 Tax=Nelumbo nucifera TaxID=4432 RepID=A0A1U8AWR4_NELNU|nr:PREDICTED: receptor-like serine/threonine-protein kinase At2g45590 [Nelumbo nucifera]
MPSRLLSPPPLILPAEISPPKPPPLSESTHNRPINSRLVTPIAAGAAAFSILLCLVCLYRKFSRRRTAPSDLKPPYRFSYSTLRHATSSFSPDNRLGQGGFGSVYRGTLPSGQEIAVKLMDSGSLQGEREFQNELSLAGKIDCDRVVTLLGFSCDRRRRRMLLVYELMHNRSLQDALLDRKCPELMSWNKRFLIAMDIAKGLEFLHTVCDPPVIHGDIKPSNILLDCFFSAKIADFGLARLKAEEVSEVLLDVADGGAAKINNTSKGKKKEGSEINGGAEDNGSILEETESVATGYEEVNIGADQSPESFLRVPDVEASPETVVVEASPSELLDKTSVSEGYFDKLSVDSGKDLVSGDGNRRGGRKKSISGKDWWWRQDNGGGSESGRVKDYVMEWIGTEIKERPKSDWIATSASVEDGKPVGKSESKKQQKRMEWWTSLDEEKIRKKEKRRPAREWWREEFCEELSRKKKRGIKHSGGSGVDNWWQGDEDFGADTRKKKKSRSRSRSSRGSIDWWLDGISGELRGGRRNSQDWVSGEIPKSGGVSSTPSMRGTVCYVAPEYGGGGQLSEKCDVYSFGVLLLVLVSGRRPLQVTASPMSEFERANLISWARHLARRGKLLDLVDPSILGLDRDQALLCITVALLCLQRSPARRPSMKEVAAMLSGESEPPHLPFEFSPSPPSSFPFKSRKKPR